MCKFLCSSQEPENGLSSIGLSLCMQFSCQHTDDEEELTIQMSVDQDFIFSLFFSFQVNPKPWSEY